MCCSFHKLNAIGIQALEKSNLRVSSFRCRKGSREARNLPVESIRATTGREVAEKHFSPKLRKQNCEQKLLVVDFPPTSRGSATITTKAGGAEWNQQSGFIQGQPVMHGTALQARTPSPSHSWRGNSSCCFICFPRVAGKKPVYTELVTATNWNSCPKWPVSWHLCSGPSTSWLFLVPQAGPN